MSVSLPTIGTAVVDATRYDVVTQVNRSKPPRSAITLGIAVETTVWSRADRKRASTTPPIVRMTCLLGSWTKSLATDWSAVESAAG